jgi:hypothetical protein
MSRTAATLAIAALGLAACMSQPPRQSEPRITTLEVPYRPGQGVVTAAVQAPAPVAAAAGGTAATSRTVAATSPSPATSASPAPYRLTIRMDNGTVQYIDTDSPEIPVGSRVELGADRTIRKL